MTIIAVDIGGTFTDVCAIYEAGGQRLLAWTKEPSTPSDPSVGVVSAVAQMLRLIGDGPERVTRMLHGTTVGTNAVLERRGAPIGVLMTEGFEDTLELGRGIRSDMYRLDPEPESPGFLAPGRRRKPVHERIGHDGAIVVPLDEAALRDAIVDLVERQKVAALCVCYLFSFINPIHEQRTAEIVASLYPDLPVSLSHEVDPLFREYERVCLTAFDAYLRPVMSGYLGRLGEALAGAGIACDVLTMQSRGSLASTRMAGARPVTTLLSGPAAGVIGAMTVAAEAGFADCVTLDMGGTSADIALITDGKPIITSAGRIGSFPLRTPMVDINTIGAGGGSIAWIDDAGGLRVGPRSAGADPGPACYGRGGTDATVTDASVVLGYLSPDIFAGGIAIDPDAAWRAIERIAVRIGLGTLEAAEGIHRIVNARMADEIRLVSLKRGFDPRQFALVPFGGGGPVCGWAVAAELEIATVLVPVAPGALCAYGLTVASLEYEAAVTVKVAADTADPDVLEAQFVSLEQSNSARMTQDGVPPEAVTATRSADLRYIGQSYELSVPMPSRITAASITDTVAELARRHRRVYGHVSDQGRAEFVNLRVAHGHRIDADARRPIARPMQVAAPPPLRKCYFRALGGMVDTRILTRAELAPGIEVAGPAVIHQADTTTVIGPGFTGRTDAHGNLILSAS